MLFNSRDYTHMGEVNSPKEMIFPIIPTMVLAVSGFTIFPNCYKESRKEERRRSKERTRAVGWEMVEGGDP